VYFYDVKIQTNIKQNLVKKIRGRVTNFLKYFFEIIFFGPGWTWLDLAHSFWTGPDLSGPVNSGALSTVRMLREQWRVK
jgi:hypothetical protein